MKKMILFVVCAMLCTVAVAQEVTQSYAVFDFKVTFKRIEPVLSTFKATGVNSKHISYNLVTDNIKGYLVVPECCDAIAAGACTSCGDVGHFGCDELGESLSYLYLARGGEKQEKTTLVKVKADNIVATVFGVGANSAYIGTDKEDEVFKKLRKSSLSMLCIFPEGMFAPRPFPVSGADTTGMRDLDYGYLGLTCLNGVVMFSGYGTATPVVKSSASYGFCSSSVTSIKCLRISSVSGTLTGMFNYGNTALCLTCDEFSITDSCAYFNPEYRSPVTGTWTLRYNTSLSGKKITDETELEALLMKNLNKKQVLDVEFMMDSKEEE